MVPLALGWPDNRGTAPGTDLERTVQRIVSGPYVTLHRRVRALISPATAAPPEAPPADPGLKHEANPCRWAPAVKVISLASPVMVIQNVEFRQCDEVSPA
jgi:hypothetical protein